MTGDELRKSILADAVRGALCPQEAADEPASALLARIREEKKRLAKEGKIKKEKNPAEIIRGADGRFYEKANGKETDITDDLPFAIPDSWEWVRLGELAYNHGQKKPTEEFCYIDIGSIDNQKQKLSQNETIVSPEKAASRARKIVQKGDILYATVRPYLHNICIVDKDFSKEPIASTGFAVLTCHAGCLNQFLFYYLLSPAFDSYANASENARGVAYPAINDERLYKAFIPVPPLAEQKRIVEKLEALRPLIDEYTAIETEETARRKTLPAELKKSVLADAVRGALCPQEAADEPASALLARIREEKKRLAKEGKIKKEKNPAEIIRGTDGRFYEKTNEKQTDITDALPFAIPDSWEWVRLGDISTYAESKRKVKARDFDSSVWSLDLEDIEKGGKLLAKKTLGERKATGDKNVFKSGDILYSKLRPYLLKVLIAPDDGICSPEIIPFHLYGEVDPNYLVLYLKSPKVDLFVNSQTYGVKMPRVGTETMANLWVPLPPLAEQKRIAARVTHLLSAIEDLKA